MKFSCSADNPARPSYDRICRDFGGTIVGIQRAENKLLDGEYHDQVLYEVLREDFLKALANRKKREYKSRKPHQKTRRISMDLEDHIGKWTIIETVNSHSRYHGFLTCVDEKGVTLRRREPDGLSFIPWDNVKQVEVFPLHSINDAKPQSKAGYNYYKALNQWLDRHRERVPADEKKPKDVVVGYNIYKSINGGPINHTEFVRVDSLPPLPTVTYSDGKEPTSPWKDLDTGELIEMLSQRPSVAKIYDIPEGSTVKCAPLLSKSWQEYLNNPAAPRIIIDGPARIVVVKK